mmetsp:Transcript_50134/g.69604  ORF Transcript_50134/g.69604 Transcript_50134/m.69604 type:complete len:251 (-) Transcript_50134:68-820(-)
MTRPKGLLSRPGADRHGHSPPNILVHVPLHGRLQLVHRLVHRCQCCANLLLHPLVGLLRRSAFLYARCEVLQTGDDLTDADAAAAADVEEVKDNLGVLTLHVQLEQQLRKSLTVQAPVPGHSRVAEQVGSSPMMDKSLQADALDHATWHKQLHPAEELVQSELGRPVCIGQPKQITGLPPAEVQLLQNLCKLGAGQPHIVIVVELLVLQMLKGFTENRLDAAIALLNLSPKVLHVQGWSGQCQRGDELGS